MWFLSEVLDEKTTLTRAEGYHFFQWPEFLLQLLQINIYTVTLKENGSLVLQIPILQYVFVNGHTASFLMQRRFGFQALICPDAEAVK